MVSQADPIDARQSRRNLHWIVLVVAAIGVVAMTLIGYQNAENNKAERKRLDDEREALELSRQQEAGKQQESIEAMLRAQAGEAERQRLEREAREKLMREQGLGEPNDAPLREIAGAPAQAAEPDWYTTALGSPITVSGGDNARELGEDRALKGLVPQGATNGADGALADVQARLRQHATQAGLPVGTADTPMSDGYQDGVAGVLGEATASSASKAERWLRDQARAAREHGAVRAEHPEALHLVAVGAGIKAALETEISTNAPGIARARVTETVYDSINGYAPLIPAGSVLTGPYHTDVSPGDERLLFAFTELRFPDGRRIHLNGTPAADLAGAGGVQADVDNHFFRIFGSSFIIAGLGKLFENNSVTVNNYGGGSSTVTDAAGSAITEAARAALERNRRIAPTLSVPSGTRFVLLVRRDIALDPYVDQRH